MLIQHWEGNSHSLKWGNLYILIYCLDLCPLSSSCSDSSTYFSINLTTCVLPSRPPTALLLQCSLFFILTLGISSALRCIQGFGFYFTNGPFLKGANYSTFSLVYCRVIRYSIFHPCKYMQWFLFVCFFKWTYGLFGLPLLQRLHFITEKQMQQSP